MKNTNDFLPESNQERKEEKVNQREIERERGLVRVSLKKRVDSILTRPEPRMNEWLEQLDSDFESNEGDEEEKMKRRKRMKRKRRKRELKI